jgi:putative transposase
VFDNPELVAEVLTEIRRAAETERFQVLTYCFMPDHLHLLVEGATDDADLQCFIKRWKQRTAFKYARARGRRLWQVGYFDHVLRSDEDTYRHALYILGNPIRAGLARTIGEYPYAGCPARWFDLSECRIDPTP